MKSIYLLLVLLLISPSLLAQASKQDTNKWPNTYLNPSPKAALTIEYTIPGSVIVSTAKRHGYKFSASNPMNATMRANCTQEGFHWVAKENWCFLIGFSYEGPVRCELLKEGWKVKEIVLQGGPVIWEVRPRNNNRLFFRAKTMANGKRINTYSIKHVTLIGPEGPFNSFEQAFKRCS